MSNRIITDSPAHINPSRNGNGKTSEQRTEGPERHQRQFRGTWAHVVLFELIESGQVSHSAGWLALEIDSLCKSKRGCYATNGYLAAKIHVKDRRIRQLLAELEEAGILKSRWESRERQLWIDYTSSQERRRADNYPAGSHIGRVRRSKRKNQRNPPTEDNARAAINCLSERQFIAYQSGNKLPPLRVIGKDPPDPYLLPNEKDVPLEGSRPASPDRLSEDVPVDSINTSVNGNGRHPKPEIADPEGESPPDHKKNTNGKGKRTRRDGDLAGFFGPAASNGKHKKWGLVKPIHFEWADTIHAIAEKASGCRVPWMRKRWAAECQKGQRTLGLPAERVDAILKFLADHSGEGLPTVTSPGQLFQARTVAWVEGRMRGEAGREEADSILW